MPLLFTYAKSVGGLCLTKEVRVMDKQHTINPTNHESVTLKSEDCEIHSFKIIEDSGYDIEQFLCRCSSKTSDDVF